MDARPLGVVDLPAVQQHQRRDVPGPLGGGASITTPPQEWPISTGRSIPSRSTRAQTSAASRGTAYCSGGSAGDAPKPGASGAKSRSPRAVSAGAISLR